jgi:cell division protein FtsZ
MGPAIEIQELRARLTVIGVGGAGNNAVARMIRKGVMGLELIAANTDAQALAISPVERILQLGRRATVGLGAGSRSDIGREAAWESRTEIERVLDASDMCFVAAGMGGGTGTGAAPVVAEIARKLGILTIGVVTKPFAFEGTRRMRAAEEGIDALANHVDSLIVVPNQNLFRIINAHTTLKTAFGLSDDILYQGVRSITDLITAPGYINLDFADIRAVLADRGRARLGTGEASGEDRAARAAEQALTDPLLDEDIAGAQSLLISIVGGDDLLLGEIDEAAARITKLVDANADIIWGSNHDPELEGRIRVSIVAAGLAKVAAPAREALPILVTPGDATADEFLVPAVAPEEPPPVCEPAVALAAPTLFERMAAASRPGAAQTFQRAAAA